jgi:hypothetical protein
LNSGKWLLDAVKNDSLQIGGTSLSMGRGELHSLSKKPFSKFIRFGCQGATNLSFQFDIEETVKKINMVASGPSPNLDL